MPDLDRALEECIQAVAEKRNLAQILRRYPDDRDELISLVRLSVEVNSLGGPSPDPAFRLRTRNLMLGLAAHRRAARTRKSFAWMPRPVARLGVAAGLAAALMVGAVGAAAASANTVPGDPLYGVKLAVERVQLAVTLDSRTRASLQLQFAEVRLNEAQRLASEGRHAQAISLVNEYDVALSEFKPSSDATPLDDDQVDALNLLLAQRQARADQRLDALQGALDAHGDLRTAARVALARDRIDSAFTGYRRDLQAQAARSQPSDSSSPRPGKPTGANN